MSSEWGAQGERIGERLACPDCCAPIDRSALGFACAKCQRNFPLREGILAILPRGLLEAEDVAASPPETEPSSAAYQQNYQRVERAARYNDKYKKQVLKRASTRREYRLLESLLGSQPRSEVLLDLPSGGGRLSPALAPYADLIVEADVAFGQLRHGRESSRLATPQLWLQASAFTIPLQARAVDGAVCVRLAHHLPAAAEREQLVRELLRVSRRFVVLTFFDFHSVKNTLRRLRQPFDRKHPKITMSRPELRRLAESCGFSLVACPALSRLFSGHRYALMVRHA